MSSNRKAYGIDPRAAKAAKLFHFCARSSDHDITLSYPAAMRAKGYSDPESKDRTLLMQVRRIAEKLSPPSSSGPPVAAAAAATALLALAAPPTNAKKHPLATISPNIPLAAVGGNGDGDSLASVKFPSPMRKTRKTAHMAQIERQNDRKMRSVSDQAHGRATALVAAERKKGEDDETRLTTNMVIAQVEGEFKERGFTVRLTKPTVNRHVAAGRIGDPPPPRGYEGTIPSHVFELLVLAVESFAQINQVNCVVIERNNLIRAVNDCCGVSSTGSVELKKSIFLRVMKSTNVSLCATVAPAIEERRIRWTTFDNLQKWFVGWRKFLLTYGFATVGPDGDQLLFEPDQLRRILNVDESEISLDGSSSMAGGKPAVIFYDPHLPMVSRSAAKSSLSCTGIFGSSAAGECIPPHWQLPTAATSADREKVRLDFFQHFRKTSGRFGWPEKKEFPATI